MDEREQHPQHENEAAASRQDELVEDLDVPEEDSRQVKGGLIAVRKAGGNKDEY